MTNFFSGIGPPTLTNRDARVLNKVLEEIIRARGMVENYAIDAPPVI